MFKWRFFEVHYFHSPQARNVFMLLFLDASSSVGRTEGSTSFDVVGSSPTLRPNSLIQGFVSDRINLPEEVLAAKSSVCNHNIRLDEEVARLLPAPKKVELGTSWSSLVKMQT